MKGSLLATGNPHLLFRHPSYVDGLNKYMKK